MSDLEKYGVPDITAYVRDVEERHAREFGHLDRPGALTPWQLRIIDYFLTRSREAGQSLRTLEVGCGASTVMFSKISTHHTALCINVDDATQGLVADIRETPGFEPGRAEFVDVASYAQLLTYVPKAAIDLAVIGRHAAHPFPEIEYFAVGRWLKSGSILVLHNIDVPCVQLLFRQLCENEMLYLAHTEGNVAFFWCAGAPVRETQTWWSQRFNIEGFPAFNPLQYTIGYSVPFALSFDGWLNELPAAFKRGVTLVGGRPAFVGSHAKLSFSLDRSTGKPLAIEFEAEFPQSQPVNILTRINGIDHPAREVNGPAKQRLVFETDVPGASAVDVEFFFTGFPGPDERVRPREPCVGRSVAMVLHALAVKPVGQGAVGQRLPASSRVDGSVVTFEFGGVPIRFFVNNPHDSIQAHHHVGQFYECEELALIAAHIPSAARVLDVGANIGNHTVWFGKVAGARYILPIEPQPRIGQLLRLNCALNGLDTVDFSQLGCALGKDTGRGRIAISDDFNPAGASIEMSSGGDVPVRVGDDVVGPADFDFVKIDVEGAELDVIDGLNGMLSRCRPMLFVEVLNENIDGFLARLDALGYEIIGKYRRYDIAINYLAGVKRSPTS